MRCKSCLLFIILLAGILKVQSQPCTTLGQTPSTAFPVCGTSTFTQNNVPICGGTIIPTACTNGTYADVNPFYYRFTCFTSGTFGFILDPINNSDDYDWVLFDITGRSPNDIFTDISLNVAENWSANPGNTGAAAGGNPLRNCAGNTPNFSRMPGILGAHEYLLMVSNWSASQQGYTLTFTGGNADITDPLSPAFQSANVDCGGQQVTVHFNKNMKCNSLAANGSDFIISPSGTIVSVTGYGCSAGFDMDSALITLSTPLAPGNYTVAAANGADGNTVLDNCGTPIPVGNGVTFTVNTAAPLPMGTIVPPSCAPTSLTLTFTEPIKCNSIAANGSDFTINGPSAVTISSATAVNCNANGETDTITIQLALPILAGGNYQVNAAVGSDGNTLIGQCNRQVTAGSRATFILAAQPALPMGSFAPLTDPCPPQTLLLHFPEPVLCSSIATNGSDFIMYAPGSFTMIPVASASGINCNANGETNDITIQFTVPLLAPGVYNLQVTIGSDGNSLVGQCGRQVSVNSGTTLNILPLPNVQFGLIAQPGCSPASLTLDLPVPVDCSSIAANGSDFQITGPSPVTIIGATGDFCNINSQTRTITIRLAAPIATSGPYQLMSATGSDGNTLTSPCFLPVPPGINSNFTIPVASFVPMDSLVPVACSPSTLKLIFASPIRCSSIATNGSDFIINGPSVITVASAAGNCDVNGLTTTIDIHLASPIVRGGSYTLQLVNGTDGNTLLSDCDRPTPAGSSKSFNTSDTVSAAFQYQVQYDCETDVISFSHDGQHNVNQWTWTINGTAAGSSQTFTQSFSSVSQNQVQLVVSNGICSDTYSSSIVLNNKVTVDFDFPESVCPDDTVIFKNKSTGQIDFWQWTFGNGNTGPIQNPPAQTYPLTGIEKLYTVSLTAGNSGCRATATKTLKVLSACIIAVPTAFTPNHDGINDYLYPLNALKAENLDFKVFNRWGQLIFHSKNWTKKWDGTMDGIPQAAGVYIWMLDFTQKDTWQKYAMRGTTTLIR